MRPFRSFQAAVAAAAMIAAAALVPAAASARTGMVRPAGGDGIPGSYVVVFKPRTGVAATTASALTARYGGTATSVWQHALHGFALRGSAETAAEIAGDPRVAYVQQDEVVSVAGTQSPTPSWGLDRIDQRTLPLDNRYTFSTTASTVNAYIIDTGIRTTHVDFQGRAVFAANFTGDGINTDCNGHGTHIAGTVGGATYGVAKGVRLFAVKVLDCAGSGSTSSVISGVNWVAQHAVHPAVANVSISGTAFQPLDDAVAAAIRAGVPITVAAGNANANACLFSPARVAGALTVSATTTGAGSRLSAVDTDPRLIPANFGTCTVVFAPGGNIPSDGNTSDTATTTMSGTSMAAAHTAGAVALFLAAHPDASPAQARAAITGAATPNVIADAGPGSPNLMLFTG
jgi:subtilisin family serine protease